VSTQKAQKRRQERYRQQKHQGKLAARKWAAAAADLLDLTRDGRVFCLHYQRTVRVGDDWFVVLAPGRRGRDVAVCPDCMTRLFGPDWADLAADLLRAVA
jgi:hypothetical protein